MWIRIADTLPTDPKIIAIARGCGIVTPLAVGHVVQVLLQLPSHAQDGDLSAIPAEAVEGWAGWTGEYGLFDRMFRTQFCDAFSVIKSWEKHNGYAIRERGRKRQRNRDEIPEDGPNARGMRARKIEMRAEKPEMRAPTNTNTIRTTSSSASAREDHAADADPVWPALTPTTENRTPAPAPYTADLEPPPELAQPEHRAAWQCVVRAARSPLAVAHSIAAVASGLHGPPTAWDTIGRALLELLAAGANFTPATLRGFVRRLEHPDAPRPSLTTPKAEETWDEVAARWAAEPLPATAPVALPPTPPAPPPDAAKFVPTLPVKGSAYVA